MNRLISLSFSIGLLFSFFSVLSQDGYQIEVNIEGFEQKEAYLAYYYGDKQYIKDTAQAEAGRFIFAGEEPLDGGIYLVVLPPDNQYFEIIVDQDQEFEIWTSLSGLVPQMKIEGSKDNTIFYDDIRFLAAKRKEVETTQQLLQSQPENVELKQKIGQINQEVQTYRENLMAQHPERLYAKVLQSMKEPKIPESPKDEQGNEIDSLFNYKYYKQHFFDHIDFSDSRLLRTPVMYNKVNQYLEKLTYKVPDSLVVSIDRVVSLAKADDEVFQFFVVNLLNKYANSKIMGMDAIYVHMVESYYMSGEAWWSDSATVAKMTERALSISPTLINRQAPNFWAPDAANKQHYLHKVPGSYTVLYFWDIDCGHCKKITPELSKAMQQYQEHDITLFTVSINGAQEEWKERLTDYELLDLKQAVHTHDPYRRSGFDGLYDLRSTPRLFLLDQDKKIMAKQISVEQMEEILNRELGLAPPEKESESTEEDTGDR